MDDALDVVRVGICAAEPIRDGSQPEVIRHVGLVRCDNYVVPLAYANTDAVDTVWHNGDKVC